MQTNRREFIKSAFKIGGAAALVSLGLSVKEIKAFVGTIGSGAQQSAGSASITYDATGAGDTISTGTSLSFSITIGATATKVMIIIGGEVAADWSVTTGTFDGNNFLTNLAVFESNNGGGGTYNKLFMYYYDSPGSGAKTVVFETSDSGAYVANAISYIGASAGAPEATAKNQDNDSSYSLGITTLTDGAWIVSAVNSNANNTITPTSSQVERYDQQDGGNNCQIEMCDFEKATAGLETGTWTTTGNTRGCVVSASIK